MHEQDIRDFTSMMKDRGWTIVEPPQGDKTPRDYFYVLKGEQKRLTDKGEQDDIITLRAVAIVRAEKFDISTWKTVFYSPITEMVFVYKGKFDPAVSTLPTVVRHRLAELYALDDAGNSAFDAMFGKGHRALTVRGASAPTFPVSNIMQTIRDASGHKGPGPS